MKDRVPKYPGRVRMTRADGTAEYVTLTRADEPQVEGDALNKANLLPDDVAAALGLSGNPQVKDALISLRNAFDSSVVCGEEVLAKGGSPHNIALGFEPKLVVVYNPDVSSQIAVAGGSTPRCDDVPRIITGIYPDGWTTTNRNGFSIGYTLSPGVEAITIYYAALK